MLDRVAPQLGDYQPYFAARAEVLIHLKQFKAAAFALDRAIALSAVASEKTYLNARKQVVLARFTA